MSDPLELAGVGLGGATVGGLLIGLVKALGSRNISALDKTLSELATAVTDLRKEVQTLREAHVALAKDIGALQEGFRLLQQRVDGQGTFWREQFEEHRKAVHDRMTEATHAMLRHAEEAFEAGQKAGRRK
jgi:hypothetical protein